MTDVHGTLMMSGWRYRYTVVSQLSETGQGILGSKTGRGKYDMWYDWVVKALVSSLGD